MKKTRPHSIFILSFLVLLDGVLWYAIIFAPARDAPKIFFLDVGQGDSSLIVLPGNVKILTDAGPDASIVRRLEEVLAPGDRHIDLGIITHPEEDHMRGFYSLLDRYTFGAFIGNGREREGTWKAIYEKIQKKNTALLTLGKGDRIRIRDTIIKILSPDMQWRESAALNDTGIAAQIVTPSFTILLAADIGSDLENELLRAYALHSHVLKVGHHGSKNSSRSEFLEEVHPYIAVIQAGRDNRYGHPHKDTLRRLEAVGAKVFRTDKDGTLLIKHNARGLQVLRKRQRQFAPL